MLTYQSVRRARTVSIIRGARDRVEGVTRTSPRVYQLHVIVVVNLPAEPLDVHLDEVGHRIEAVVPHVLGDVGSPHDLTLAFRQILEEAVFLGRELDEASGALNASGTCVDRQIAH
ncbi:hypothetical protein D3C83_29760 [compost metagenome]